MRFRLSRAIIMLIVIFTFYSSEAFARQNSDSQEKEKQIAFLDTMVTENNAISLKNNPVTHAIAYLRFQYNCAISVEQIEYTKEDCIVGNLWVVKNRSQVDRTFSGLTVREILDELVQIDPGYHWKIYDGKYVVFEPRTKKYGGKEKSVLDTIVSVSADNVPMSTLLSPYSGHLFGRELLYSIGLSRFKTSIGKARPRSHKIPISVHLENVPLRDAFNAIAAAAEHVTGDRFRWFINGHKYSGKDKYGKMLTVRNVTFNTAQRR